MFEPHLQGGEHSGPALTVAKCTLGPGFGWVPRCLGNGDEGSGGITGNRLELKGDGGFSGLAHDFAAVPSNDYAVSGEGLEYSNGERAREVMEIPLDYGSRATVPPCQRRMGLVKEARALHNLSAARLISAGLS